MGLDSVEIVLEVEKTYGIKISDSEATRAITVGDFWDLLCRKTSFTSPKSCASAAAFYRLRRSIIDVLGLQRCALHPHTPLDEVLPYAQRSFVYHSIENSLQLKLPELEFSEGQWNRINWASVTVGVLCGGALALQGIYGLAIVSVPLLALTTSFLLNYCLKPWRCTFEGSPRTLGDLAKLLVAWNPQSWFQPHSHSKDVQWERFRKLIATQLGVPISTVVPDARFVEDLGCD